MQQHKPHYELRRIYTDGSQTTESIELYKLIEVIKQGRSLKAARRGFLGLSALSVGALAAACQALITVTPTAPSAIMTPQKSAPATPTVTASPTETTAATLTPTASPTSAPLPTSTPTPTPRPIGQARSQGLNLRVGPGLNYGVILTFRSGVQFTLLARHAILEWIEVRAGSGEIGWVYAPLVILEPGFDLFSLPIEETIPPTPVPPPTAPSTSPPPPTVAPTAPLPPASGGPICECNQICVCIPVYY